jgi:hypothetical protein
MSDERAIIDQAIRKRTCLSAFYGNRRRHFAPHAIGRDDSGTLNVLVFQYAGQGNTKLSPEGEWRCFRVASLLDLTQNDDPWPSARPSGWPTACLVGIEAGALPAG